MHSTTLALTACLTACLAASIGCGGFASGAPSTHSANRSGDFAEISLPSYGARLVRQL